MMTFTLWIQVLSGKGLGPQIIPGYPSRASEATAGSVGIPHNLHITVYR